VALTYVLILTKAHFRTKTNVLEFTKVWGSPRILLNHT